MGELDESGEHVSLSPLEKSDESQMISFTHQMAPGSYQGTEGLLEHFHSGKVWAS